MSHLCHLNVLSSLFINNFYACGFLPRYLLLTNEKNFLPSLCGIKWPQYFAFYLKVFCFLFPPVAVSLASGFGHVIWDCVFLIRTMRSKATIGTWEFKGPFSKSCILLFCLCDPEPTCSSSASHRVQFSVWQRPPHGFQKKMKLEVIDKRNPVFIRVATVADTDDHRIKVSVLCCRFVLSFVTR